MNYSKLFTSFFEKDAVELAKDLLGKVIVHVDHTTGISLKVQIIETEAYYIHEKGSHSSLGFTEKRKALFMPPGTIYMYYARGSDSLNFSALGEGNAVLVKSGFPFMEDSNPEMINRMQELNSLPNSAQPRPISKLCNGQTLVCKSLNLKVKERDQTQLDEHLFLLDTGYAPAKIIQTSRLGIPTGRDEHLQLRFIDYNFVKYCTKNPLTRRTAKKGETYKILP